MSFPPPPCCACGQPAVGGKLIRAEDAAQWAPRPDEFVGLYLCDPCAKKPVSECIAAFDERNRWLGRQACGGCGRRPANHGAPLVCRQQRPAMAQHAFCGACIEKPEAEIVRLFDARQSLTALRTWECCCCGRQEPTFVPFGSPIKYICDECRNNSLSRILGMFEERLQRNPIRGTAVKASETIAVTPIPIRLVCPECGMLHIDEGEFATKPHHTHACQGCGLTWRPAVAYTVGVRFLPGFKNDPIPS